MYYKCIGYNIADGADVHYYPTNNALYESGNNRDIRYMYVRRVGGEINTAFSN